MSPSELPPNSANREWRFHARCEAETDEIGKQIADLLCSGDTVGLVGTLGAGKTRLVQAIAVALGISREQVVSPTFNLCNEYLGDAVSLYHLDLYRVVDEDELLEIGFDEYCSSDWVTLIEWSDRFPTEMPDQRVEICIDVTGETSRTYRVSRIGR